MLFQNNLLRHFPKVNSLQSWEYYDKTVLILWLAMNYSNVTKNVFSHFLEELSVNWA